MKIYISGAISGLERKDYLERFAKAEIFLKKKGHDVINPTKLLPSKHLWIFHIIGYNLTLLYDLWHLMDCDGIYMIKGWECSKGASLEKAFADIFGLKTIQ